MPSTADLPTVFPIFPLSGAVLFPRATMPLNIFEPRYLDMVRDAQAGAGIIGMIQPRDAGGPGDPPVFDVGCAGRLDRVEETGDGRLLIALEGLCRFRVVEELTCTTLYRQVSADFTPFLSDLEPPAAHGTVDRERLLALLKAYLDDRGLEAEWDALHRIDDETLVSALAMLCPFDTPEKQALLEEPTLTGRAKAVMLLLQFETMAADPTSAAPH
ncbi:hypothetical protein EV659_1114 [Rhodothalassium salexigens DSM 2132]|uniref:Lon N-terminal domain-containing protein n=1 Tax=Rhodothalassium salexigens DSM 2132 TaxID=1188247 RepID=A0A4R2P969_RHOSA|nr:LON peptidase substrate-binding domain-containing protein [Rhodothalassium salexigens]MBB4212523.1 hypothetical protein [Rhodothalassium salexigens DSM 2132]MBK1640176.1 hypothetical protein [Rhodothalassium salexigens DSM 2132]TCP31437.1 hypothetical protein EV659_1114 [Rhodothalassium salexigens DSM 2132]